MVRPADGDPFRVAAEDAGLLTRPLRLNAAWLCRERRNAWLLATALWLALALGALWTTLFVVDVMRVQRIWTEGVDAETVTLHGSERSSAFVVRNTAFDVEYTDRAGAPHRGEAWFFSIGIGGDVVSGLRYDPEHPDDFATSYEYERIFGRALFTSLLVAMLVGAGVAGSRGARHKLREIADIRETIHAGGIGIPLRIVEAWKEIDKGRVVAIRYTLELPDGTVIVRKRVVTNPPFLLHVATNHVLGLRHPQRPDLVVLLDPDLAPLEVDAGEAESVRKRYQAQRDANRGA